MIDKVLTFAAGCYAIHKSVNMALLRFAFRGERRREPLIEQLSKKKPNITAQTIIEVRK
jgi:hypothetical protein